MKMFYEQLGKIFQYFQKVSKNLLPKITNFVEFSHCENIYQEYKNYLIQLNPVIVLKDHFSHFSKIAQN